VLRILFSSPSESKQRTNSLLEMRLEAVNSTLGQRPIYLAVQVRLCRKYWTSHELHCASIVQVTCISPLQPISIGAYGREDGTLLDVEMSWQVRGSRRHIVCCATTCAHPLDPTPAEAALPEWRCTGAI
jgi:hypothetical protein